jgi:predicted deacetylase
MLSDLGISDYTLLITPFYLMKKSNTFSPDSMFTKFLQSLGLEIALHGYSHITKSGAEDEFSRVNTKQAEKRMKNGKAMLKRGLGVSPAGFIPPLWVAPPLVSKVARRLRFGYCVRENTVDSISDDLSLSVAARIIGDGSRNLSTADAMLEIQLGGSLQIGVHPLDYRKNKMFDLLTDLRDNLDYRFTGYSSFLSSST